MTGAETALTHSLPSLPPRSAQVFAAADDGDGGGGDDDVVDGCRQLFPSLPEEKRLETWPRAHGSLPRSVGC